MKKSLILLTIILIFALCGCDKKEEINKNGKIGFVVSVEDINNNNPNYYAQVATLRSVSVKPDLLKYKEEWETKYGMVAEALAWKLDRTEVDSNTLFHVAVICTTLDNDETAYEDMNKAIDEINATYGLNIDTSDWVEMCIDYYCVLTREELLALTHNKFIARYIGSGEGDMKKMDISTPEGVDTYIELYGDGFVQKIEGKEIKNYTK